MNNPFNVVKIIHIALCLGIAIAYIFVDFNNFANYFTLHEFNAHLLLYVGIFVAAIALSHFLYKSKVKTADKNLPQENRLLLYQAATINRWAPIEAAAFIFLFLDSNYRLLGVFMLLYLIYLRPTELEFNRDF